ncbi:unnamed protein product [Natator depressus]
MRLSCQVGKYPLLKMTRETELASAERCCQIRKRLRSLQRERDRRRAARPARRARSAALEAPGLVLSSPQHGAARPPAGPGPSCAPWLGLSRRGALPAVPGGGAGGAAEPVSPGSGWAGAAAQAEPCRARCSPCRRQTERLRPWGSRAARLVLLPRGRRLRPLAAAAAEPHGPGPAPRLLRAEQTHSLWNY